MESHGIPINVLERALNLSYRQIIHRIEAGQFKSFEVKCNKGGKNGVQKLVYFSSLNPKEQSLILQHANKPDNSNPGFYIDILQDLKTHKEEDLKKAIIREEACIEILSVRNEVPLSRKKLGQVQKYWAQKLDLRQEVIIRMVKSYEEKGFQSLIRKKRYDKGIQKSVCLAGSALLKDLYCNEHKPTIKGVYKKAIKEAESFGVNYCFECEFALNCHEIDREGIKINNYSAAYKTIKQLTAAEIARWRYGPEEYRKKYMPKTRISLDDIMVNEQWVGDHHEFDFYAVDSEGNVGRPWVTGWLDRRSGCLVGYAISFQPNSSTIAAALAHGMKPKPNSPFQGKPKGLQMDNGKDYRCQFLNGTKEIESKEQYRLKCQGVFKALNLDLSFCKHYSPWSKMIERFFKEVVDKFSREELSWLGNRPSERPSNWNKIVKKLIQEKKIPTLAEIQVLFEKWLDVYHNTYQKERGGTPLEIYQTTSRVELPIPNETALTILFMHEESRKVHPTGIQLNNLNYVNNVKLALYVGEKLRIKYDPNYLDEIYVFKNNDFICTAKLRKNGSIHSSNDEISDHIKSQKEAAKVITERRKTYTLKPKRTKSKEVITGETLPSSQSKVIQVTGYENLPVRNKKEPTGSKKNRTAFDKFIMEYGDKAQGW